MAVTYLTRRSILLLMVFSCVLMSGCASGSRVLDEPVPMTATKPLVSESRQGLDVTLNWVIVRNGPGAWAEKVDWDEYWVTVRNDNQDSIQVTGFEVIDSLGFPVRQQVNRKSLVKQSRSTVKRYDSSDLRVEAGAGPGTLLASGGVAFVGGGMVAGKVLASALMGGFASGSTVASTAGMAATGLFIAGPVIAVNGLIKASRHRAVDAEIQNRRTALPVEIMPGDELTFTVYFPIAPSPQALTLEYTQGEDELRLFIDTAEVLDGLHIRE